MPCAAIDLFCGVGGLTKGLEQAGINVVAGIDFEASCQYAYEENNNAKFIQRDITTVLPEELAALYPDDLNIHILAGCAPCQPFSKYTQRYRKDGYKDEKWRLLYSFGTLAKGIKPEIIAMENVPELEKTPVFADFVKELEECGYHILHKIVYCPDYGVPQSRKRLVLLASLFGKISLLPATHTPDKYVTVKDAIGNLPPLIAGSTDPNDLMHSATALSEKNLKRIRQSTPGGTWRDWDKELQLKCHKHILLFMGECGGMLHHLLLQRSFMAMEMGVLAIRPKIVHCHYEKALFCNHFPKITSLLGQPISLISANWACR